METVWKHARVEISVTLAALDNRAHRGDSTEQAILVKLPAILVKTSILPSF